MSHRDSQQHLIKGLYEDRRKSVTNNWRTYVKNVQYWCSVREI